MARHAKTDSDVTSLAPSSPPRRPAYYVLSPAASHPDVLLPASGGGEKMSLAGSTPAESPVHYHFNRHSGAGVHHSREFSTGRLLFSDQLRSGGGAPWRQLGGHGSGAGSVGCDDDEEESLRGEPASPWRCYALGAFAFFAVFAFFLLVLWGASKSYKPHVVVKIASKFLVFDFPKIDEHWNYSVVFESYHIQGGTDRTGVPRKMMSVNATVRLRIRNRGTFFGLHVTATPFLLFFDDLTVASGEDLYVLGARKLAVIDVPPIGCFPYPRSLHPLGACIDVLNELAGGFNKGVKDAMRGLGASLPGLKYSIGSSHAVVQSNMKHPQRLGFKEVTTACCGSGKFNGASGCTPNATLCDNRHEYLFWDLLHPTHATSKLAAAAIYNGSLHFAAPINFRQLAEDQY